MDDDKHNKIKFTKNLHHGGGIQKLAGQSIYIRNQAHQESKGLRWVGGAISKVTLGTLRDLTQSR